MRDEVDPAAELGAASDAVEVEVLILGAGVCGISVGVGCLRAGIDDIVVIERADGPGGTWRHNTYPGCAVDIPTHVYSFSWAPNPGWEHTFARQPEVKAYLENIVERCGLAEKTRYGVEMLGADWDDTAHLWRVETTHGTYLARHLVTAPGPLHEPQIPDLPGLDSFEGQAFHSSHWPDDLDLEGKNVVVLGTGASALQFVPAIQPQVGHLTVLQRTPSWVMPKADWRTSALERRALGRFPSLLRGYREVQWATMDFFVDRAVNHVRYANMFKAIGKWHMRRHVKDPALREILTPDYSPTCKRLGLSNDFYRAVVQPNVEVLASAGARLGPHAVETVDGRLIDADVVIFGTGFHTLQTHPVNRQIRGRGGVSLEDRWHGSPTAHMGTTVAGFPNMYFMFGPNVGTLSGFVMAEAQTDYILGAMRAMAPREWTSIEVRPEAQAAFVRHTDEVLNRSTFLLGGCSSYYLAADGTRASLPWPGTMRDLCRTLALFDAESYEGRRPPAPAPAVGHESRRLPPGRR